MIFTLEDPFTSKHDINSAYIETVKKKLGQTRAFLKDIDTYPEFASEMRLYDFIVNDPDPVARALEYKKKIETLQKTWGPRMPKTRVAIELGWSI